MIRRQHVTRDFFEDAEAMRAALDGRIRDAYTHGINWHYFCDPGIYTYLRAEPQGVFPQEIFERFMKRLRTWCIDNLGLVPADTPYLNLMVNGCRLGLHSDFHNGAWGYVYSLTHWDTRKFAGGETLLVRDGIPSYKKHHVHGEVLYELIPAHFNQLLVFDDRIVHATPTIEGSMNPLEGRIALVGHIRATSLVVTGGLSDGQARRAIVEVLPQLRERIRNYKDVQGTISYRLVVAPTGTVAEATILTDNVVTPMSGYAPSDVVSNVRACIHQTMTKLQFPESRTQSTIIIPLLIPFPDLQPIKVVLPHTRSVETICVWADGHLADIGRLTIEGRWEDHKFLVQKPIAGVIRIEPHEISASFDAPMWVPSQRERFEVALSDWVKSAAAAGGEAH